MKKEANITIHINGQKIKATKGELLLDVIRKQGINIPTLCHFEGKHSDYPCRICIVYDENSKSYIPSCNTRITEELNITTHSPELLKKRSMLLELILANHPDDCLYCVKNNACELRLLANELNVDQRRFHTKEIAFNTDKSSPAITREYAKCILCGKCVTICNEVQKCNVLQFNNKGKQSRIEPEFGKLLYQSACVYCGKCLQVCPTASLYERENISAFFSSLGNTAQKTISIFSPILEFDQAITSLNKTARSRENHTVSILRKSGSNHVFSLNPAIDLYLYELLNEFKATLKENKTLISTFCPSAELYIQKSLYNENIKLSALIKPIYFFQKMLEHIYPESKFQLHEFTTCVAQKHIHAIESVKDKNYAYTVRELMKIKQTTSYGNNSSNVKTDEPFHLFSALSYLPFIPGGMSEAIVRMLSLENNAANNNINFDSFRNVENFGIVKITLHQREYSFGIINGMSHIKTALETWENRLPAFIEILACPNGCYYGGGASKENQNTEFKQFSKQWFEIFDQTLIRYPQRNTQLISLYQEIKEKQSSDSSLFYIQKEE
ncbi:MAG TPA: [Fe-Fe] hydrogenase large subunit C-terminal domain-containing protein [Bacteroidales bacterium]|jgi:iron only hydrogenase large subunit-like protein/ferredoxin|nr:4Fe-4S binding protein [Bacteroidales bacterium]HNV96509.1 [Fe-Fe] hydrogenase large subunit C-terminal domain-containing protein [Bacteroidales bacterium]